jgi:hypothetical protein
MKYDLAQKLVADKVLRRVLRLIKKGALIDLTEISLKTLSQNNYFHLIVAYFAGEHGMSAISIKEEYIKRGLCKDIFVEERVSEVTGEIYTHVRSFSELKKEETSDVISMFYNHCLNDLDFRLPHPDNLMYEEEMKQLINEVEKTKNYV